MGIFDAIGEFGSAFGNFGLGGYIVLAVLALMILSFLFGALLFYFPANPLPATIYNGTYLACGPGCATTSGLFISASNITNSFSAYSLQYCQAFAYGAACSTQYNLYVAKPGGVSASNINDKATMVSISTDINTTNKQISNCATQSNCNPSQIAGLMAQLNAQQTQLSIFQKTLTYNNGIGKTTTTVNVNVTVTTNPTSVSSVPTTATTQVTTATTATTTGTTTTVNCINCPPRNPSIIGALLNPIILWLNTSFGLNLGYFS